MESLGSALVLQELEMQLEVPGRGAGGLGALRATAASAASLDAVLSKTQAGRPLTRVGALRDKFPPAPTFL